ncbi:Spy0128 family protein [Collinsella aerofaciens]|uniref:Spy0128 family protein n=1 Tax=Collinsella aerofaciens TaxID=74426 RepID=UPI00148501F2|nr:FctA domain-containing protein [Collinsella aerofaciens]MDB1901722.1 FctA domain-containing protein [Collinsella aerofaciens]MDB1905166.1 FctA domain-containing protein [Collinsella aerofaciens]
MSYGRRRGLRPVSPYAIVLALAVALTASFFLPLRAEAAISDHTVPTTSPSGTTINLFDYWVNPDDHLSVSGSGGVNAGHKFQFNDGKGDGPLNQWTGSTSPRPGIVNNTLSDGYPKLSEALGDESLRYLFDSSAQTGKTSHFGVTGLLKVQGGYYVYDSSENYAAYNADKNAFDIYGTWGIDKVGDSSHQGQFFPFDAADKVFKEENGQLVQTGIKADNTGDSHYNGGKPVNHHFGLSMSTRFVQPKGGLTNNNNDMTFEFAGDDDVWVFIDDVLVGDIGGIHNRASLSINFHTGNIKVNDNYNGTLKSKYQKAGKAGDTSWEGNTFADDTNHTLKFFYLERGATDSNMELKFNLVTVPESDIIKFDQDGKFVQSAEFALYKTDENFTDTTNDKNALLGSGTTDEAGHLTLTNDDDNGVINFDDLYNKNHGNKYYLLKETRVPEGYRSSLTATGGSMQLEYVPASAENGAGGVIINRGGMDADSVVWKTGAFAGAKETITAPVNVYKANDDLTKSDETVNLKSGILFAVVLKRDKSANADIKNQNNWYAVSGDPSTGMGYTLAEKPSKAGAIEAAKKDLHAFTLNTSGQYQVEIQNLPGDISKYYYLLSGDARKDAEYTVAIYHTTASSIANANTDNTVHVFSDDLPSGEKNFQRQFATRLLVTNIQNRLFVQKTDTAGKPVEGAKFGLYTADQVTTDANGKVVLKGEQTPYDTLTTGSVGNPVPLEGAGIFPNTSKEHKPLTKRTYYLKEISAPSGFLLNDTLTKVIVDDYGVHADAGTRDDGVSTFVGPGALMKSLGQFGAESDIDNTLTWIKGVRQTSNGVTDTDGNLSWSNVDPAGAGDTVHLKYGANGRVYQYGPTEEGKPYRLETETGWIRMGITQDEQPKGTKSKGARADLRDMNNLNALFTGATCVRVANKREASLEVTKKVDVPDGLTGNKDAEFTFKFTVPKGKTYKAAVFEKAGAADEKQVGDMFDLTNGREQTITAGQTIRVYGLAEGDKYTVQELTRAGKMPAGFTLTKREQGGNALGGEGDSISGTIAKQNADGTLAEANKLVFTNTYSVKSPVTLTNAFWAQKVLQGRDWKDGDSFKIYLRADKGTPMPDGAENAPVSGMKQVVKTVENGDKFDFGEIEYTKPGTYTYLIAEATPSQNDASWLPGFGYSSASYRVTVTVKDSGDGTLSQPAVKMEQTYTDDGVSHEDSPIEVADKIAKITNTYNTDEKTISFHVQKTYVDQSGANPLVKDKFTFQLEALGGMKNDAVPSGTLKFGDLAYSVDASKVPMPMGCTSTTTTAKNDDGGIAAFPQITYTMGSENLTYVYRVTEVKDSDTSTSSGMGYDDAVYYVLVKNQQVDNESGTGRCLSSTVTYWKADGTQLTDANGYIPFKNTYTVTQATSAPIRVQKTFTGRAWETSDTFDFTLTPADDATTKAVKNKVVIQKTGTGEDVGDIAAKISISGDGSSVTRTAAFGVGDLVFTKPGTYKFKVNEKASENVDKTGISYDGHTSTVTYTVTDIENGTHTGKLTATVAYDNKQAMTDVDRQVTGAAAFTNTYTASGTYAGIDVTKTLVGTPLKNGMFPFTIEAMTYNGTTAPEPADTDKSFKNTVGKDDGDDTQTATMSGKLKMNFTQLSYNKVYVYKVSEAHGANAGGYTYDTEYPGDAYVLIAVTPNPDNKGQLYTETTIVKGPDVTALVGENDNVDALTAEAIKGLDTTTNYVKTVSSRNAKPATPTVPFKNSYKSDASDELTPQVTKKISGVESTEKAFSFTLTATEETQQKIAAGDLGVSDDLAGDAHAESKVTSGKIIKDKGQTVDFSNMAFNKAGEYTFTLTEVHNADDDPAADGVQNAGWTMDDSTYTVTVKVEDKNAKLTVTGVTVEKGGDDKSETLEVKNGKVNLATFNNTYDAKGSVTLAAKKHFTGGTLENQQFSFQVKEGNKVVAEEKNDANGNITFPAIYYTEAGEHDYTIKEVEGADPTIVYDGKTVKVHVSVTDNKNGTLSAAATYDGEKAVPTFTNSKPTADATIEATKILKGKDLTAGAFTFGLYQGDTTTVDPIQTVQNDKDGKIKLILTGLTIGEYDYTLKEVADSDSTITYDFTAVKVHVSVKADGDKAKATVTYDDKNDAPTFTNKYQPAETLATLTAKKSYVKSDNTQATLRGGEFTFDLYEGDLTAEQLKGKQPIQTAKNGEDGTVTFPAINYTKAGEYKYTIVEQKGDLSHVVYDDAVHHAVVKVVDNAGQLEASVTYDDGKTVAPTFTNTYTAKGSVELTATKIVAVAPGFTHDTKLKGGEYTFELKDADGKVLGTTTNKADGTVKFTRKFTLSNLGGAASKDFTYTIAEKPGTEPGMVYDTHALIYKVTVADDGTGSLTATPQVTSGDKTFTNTYHPKETSVTLKATKRFTGGELAGGDFTFQLLDKDGNVIQTVQNDKDGKVAFQAISYDTPGDHDYTIKEVAGNDPTVVYDTKDVKVHIKVSDEKGELKATATYDGEADVPTFTNSKPTTDVTVEATKILTGKDLTADAFTFGLYDQAGNEVAKGTNDRGGKVELAVKNLNLGEYDYTLKEEKAGQTVDGVAYDAKEVKVHVKVEQNQGDNNKTKVTVTYDGAATAPTFNNTYDAKGSVTLTATKTIKVADGFDHTTKPADGEFTFDLKDAAGNVLDTAKNDANGKVSFTREFQLSDLDGAASKDFTYTIVEQPGAEPGMVYDSHPLTYTVTVADGGNGALNAKAIVTSASGSDTFTNTYQPAATGLALGAQKSYVKKDDNTPIVPKCGEFTFDVYEGNLTAEQLAGAKPVRTATNGADGSVNFDAFSYAKPGTHEYTIVERKGDLAYVTYDAAVHHAVVTVADNAGTLQASVAYDGTNVTKPSFTNTYEAQATDSGAIALTKSVDVHDGSYQLKAGDFAFELVGSDGSVIQTQKNDAHGKVAFDKLTFDHAGTFTYTVREVQPTGDAPGVPGVTYTGKTYTLTYVVKDNNDGKLVVENSTVKPSEGTENGVTPNTMTFANSYQPGATSYQISGTKVLENTDSATMRTPADGEFTFALIDVATGQEIDRTTNVGNAFTFKAISYTATGSHAYQVKEVAGQDGTITYSDAVLDVTVSATDDGSGQLTATANKTAADLTFTNTYTPTATTATITGTKALTGRDLAEGEFFFDLKDADGNVVQTVQNGADGTFGFAPLQLDKVGTYVYTVSERAGATANGVTYDTTVFTATVTVTENAETHALEAQVAYSKGGKAADAVAFSNSYAPAATEVKLGASKVLSGEDLKEGQFSFQLKDADGKVLQTAKNAADGTVGFEAISYDKPGTYAYSISEVDDGQKNVTYDAAEHRVTVTVTDDGAGHLVATVTYDGAVAPVFKNTYTPPTTPPTEPPTNPPSKSPVPKEEKPGLPYTGDTSLSPMALGGIAGGAVVLIAAGVILRRRNR